ncbi:MAG: hypothetical protein ACE5G3_04410 [Gammaproteobacteria bacterium]
MHAANIRRLLLLGLTAVGCVTASAIANARGTDLIGWTDRQLIPHVTDRLTEHPRFRGETVVFIALEGGAPAPVTNALVLALRDRLVDAIIDAPGVSIGRQTRHDAAQPDAAHVDCTRDAVHYYFGLEAVRLVDGRHRVTLRILDVEDQSWVSGVGKTWEGRLTSAQRRAFEQRRTDADFLGDRDVPFSASQTDMLAAHLAHDLACALARQTRDGYTIAATSPADSASPLAGIIELVRNNLAGHPSLRITAGESAANAMLEGKAHRIAGELHQYWITVTPRAGSKQVPAVSASAYVHVPAPNADRSRTVDPRPPVSAYPAEPSPPPDRSEPFLSPIRVFEPRQRRACYRAGSSRWKRQLVPADYTVGRGECFLLQTRAHRDASVLLLNYQVDRGLVRWPGSGCSAASKMIEVRAGQQLRFPAAGDARPSASAWQGREGLESFYAVAVGNREAALELEELIEAVPARCTVSAREGLSGTGLRDWLAAFAGFMDHWQGDVHWQAIRIRHVQ